MVKKLTNTSKQTSLFDIRLKNHEHDVLVLKGSPEDAGSALLSGKIVLSVKEPFAIKKMGLRLYATLRLNWSDQINTPKGSYPKSIRHERKVYEHNWDNMEINKYLNNLYENNSSTSYPAQTSIGLSKNNSSTSLKSLSHFRSKSSNNLHGIKHSPNGSSTNLAGSQSSSGSSTNLKGSNHVLVQGNYEFPFSAILPGNIPESVEGLPGASVVYKLEATIDRGKFHNTMIAKKHLRVVRTLTTDAVELSETVAVDNTWPKKVEYSINVPSRAIAVGSGTPISLMLVPLLKGLSLGETKITLVEYYSYMGYVPPVHNGERVIVQKTIPKPSDDDPNFEMDKWEVDTFLKIPPSLSKCTQDCDILSNIKVRHKIKFAIGLVNPDGHVSELRASLPIQLFISPFVSVTATHEDVDSSSEMQNISTSEDVLFTSDRTHSHSSLNNLSGTPRAGNNATNSNSSSYTSFSGLVAPPLYEQHIYDRLWSDVSPIDSPSQSGTSTPTPRDMLPTNGLQDEFNMSPIDSVQLNENLRLLSLQRQSQEASGPPTPSNERATFSLEGGDSAANDYFSQSTNPNASARRPNLSSRNSANNFSLMSPGVVSPAAHLSRVQSETIMKSPEMLQVPSYSQAIKSDVSEDQVSPAYEPPLPGSRVNLDEVNKNYEDYVGQGTGTPSGQGSVSTRNSNNSSPSFSRNSSSSNLSNLMSHSKISSQKIQSKSLNSSIQMQPVSTASTSGSSDSGSSSGQMNGSLYAPSGQRPHSPVAVLQAGSAGNRTQSSSPNPGDNGEGNHLSPTSQTTGGSLAQPSSSAANRNVAALGSNSPLRSNSSLSLHNLHFLNKKKEKK